LIDRLTPAFQVDPDGESGNVPTPGIASCMSVGAQFALSRYNTAKVIAVVVVPEPGAARPLDRLSWWLEPLQLVAATGWADQDRVHAKASESAAVATAKNRFKVPRVPGVCRPA
jgi:hypothetical protein